MRQATWKWALALGLLACASYLALPAGLGRALLLLIVAVVCVVCVVLAVQHQPSSMRLGWRLLAASCGCFISATLFFSIDDLLRHQVPGAFTFIDVLRLSGYLLFFLGIMRMSRSRGLAVSRERHADSAVVYLGVFCLAWQVILSGYAHDPSLSITAKVVAMAYPLINLGVLFTATGAILAGVTRRASERFLLAAILGLFLATAIGRVMTMRHNSHAGSAAGVVMLFAYVMFATSALHPTSQRTLVEATDSGLRVRRWVPLVAMAGFMSPAILFLGSIFDFQVDVAVLSCAEGILFGLVVLRVCWLFIRIRSQNRLLHSHTDSLQEALATQQALETDLRYLAFHDSLTGLANRAFLQQEVETALATAAEVGSLALCICDLDQFKEVNDSLGHQVGDAFLIIASQRLTEVTGGQHTVARLGGDEFAILFAGLAEPGAATQLAERIVEALRQPAMIAGREIALSVSVGLAFASCDTTSELLISEADTAMYEAKAAGKDRWAIFETSMRLRLVDQLTVTNSFQSSLESGHFFLQYEPQVSLHDGRLEGFEALVRWEHPTLGLLPPLRFIPLAEETGFIRTLGAWILQQACIEAANWVSTTDLTISVNLSGRQLQDPELVAHVAAALAGSGLGSERLVLEITESVLMLNPKQAAQTLSELKQMGIRIAIDDFGTGYSSLSYLQQFPVDILKIDKSFIDPLEDPESEGSAFVQTIVRLAHDLNLSTIAEGVEQLSQRETLSRLECQSIQGYLLSRPMSREAVHDFITTSTATAVTTAAATEAATEAPLVTAIAPQRIDANRLGPIGRPTRAIVD
ncbi:diguanylate cyclase (GGDEF)-like protein [Jatrophihabitans sp. GAS493]|uniref:putative bifunctional diguanylate cyclase/phosphodiesterase n=1 Tax=Jatrophihabitans sp. GAS493 TaxID=1907575 RepID=UPI000BC038B7|nr:EAL domain-containing protein [Jatrophihabitans sp. GAS493]SOD70486.1 diguanylate cyclase (GGDEF)-like protein [Jatrophihabitans sp. GAS493]